MEGDKPGTTARDLALQILLQVETKDSYANILLDRLLESSRLTPADRHLVTELVYGVLRQFKALDWVIELHSDRPLSRMTATLRNILRLGVYQILFLSRIPPSAACNEAVKLAKRYGHPGLAGYTNGVLRTVVRQKDRLDWPSLSDDPGKHISVKYSHPRWLVDRWLERFGTAETLAFCAANNLIPPLTVRVNTLRVTREELKSRLQAAGVEAIDSPIAPDGLVLHGYPALRDMEAYQAGLLQVQDESSMLVAPILNPRPGDTVIDTCSAPGGKTTHLAQVMQNRGRILALDLHRRKLDLVEDSCRRLGIGIVETREGDARQADTLDGVMADGILVDAPCSGLGVLRRKPDVKWRKTPEQLLVIRELQLAILTAAADHVKPGGTLVYSTCTTEPEENEWVLTDFLRSRPDFRTDMLTPLLPPVLQGETTAAKGYLQLLPHRHGTDGFFIARTVRRP